MEKAKILVIDDEAVIRQLLLRTLSDKGYEVEVAEDGSRALEKIKSNVFNMLITDLKMPKVSGMEVLAEIKKINPYVEVIIITGYPTIDAAVEAIKIGAFDFICKPFDLLEIQTKIQLCLERQKRNLSHIQVTELTALFDLTKASILAHSVESLWELILTTALEVSGAQSGSVFLWDKQTNSFGKKFGKKLWEDAPTFTLNEEVLAKEIKKGETQLIIKEKDDKLIKELLSDGEEPNSLLIAPLVGNPLHCEESILGAVVVSAKASGDSFSERDKMLASILAGQAATILRNSELYGELEKKVEALKESIDKLHETQNQLIQTEKLASVGQLAFGIAHEIRNPLGIVLGGVEYLSTIIKTEDSDTNEAIAKIKKSISRANNIIVDLLKFSRASRLNIQEMDVCEIIDEVALLITNKAYFNSVKIEKSYQEDPLLMQGDVSMLRQVFFNICSNAVDAMPKGGVLSLNILKKSDESTGEDVVVVEIGDTGMGMSKEHCLRIFDPFFTTKDPGKGTGLGLSIVHMILERHDAKVWVESEEHKGTKFVIEMLQNKSVELKNKEGNNDG